MKLTLLFTLLSLGLSAKPLPTPSVAVDGVACVNGGASVSFTVTGAGYAKNAEILIDISGANFLEIYTVSDHHGNIDTSYPGGILFPAGVYSLTVRYLGSTAILASSSMEVNCP